MPTVVQHRSTFGSSVSTISLAYASNNTSSNLLTYCGGGGNGGTALNAPTDNNSNSIANATNITGASSSGSSRVDYVQNCNGGANTVTQTASVAQDLHLHIWEISGLATSGQPRATGTVTSSATASVSTSTSTPISGDATIAFFMDRLNSDALTAGSGFSPSELSQDVADGSSGLSEYKAVSTGGTQTATCGGNGTNVLSQSIVVFKQSVASFQPDEDFWQLGLTIINQEPVTTVW